MSASTNRRSRLAAAIMFGLAMPAAAFAQEATTSSSDQQAAALDAQAATPSADAAQASKKTAATLDKVEVTGSRIKRAQVEGPVPVIVITADDIKKEGYSTVAEALQTLTQFTGAVTGSGELSVGNQSPDAQMINLRGLGVGYQLVLLNGKRMADYASTSTAADVGVNLSSVPISAVARIEVLSGGASAIYGSDAVAGVVNIITKEGWDGNHVRVRGGTTSDGGGNTWDIQYGGGKSFEKGSITYAAEYLSRQPIYGYQRDYLSVYHSPWNLANPGKPQASQQGYLLLLANTRRAWTSNGTDPTFGAAGTSHPTTDTPKIPADLYFPDGNGGVVEYNQNLDGTFNTDNFDGLGDHSPGTAYLQALQTACAASGFSGQWSSPLLASPDRCGDYNYTSNQMFQDRFSKLSGYIAGNWKFGENTEGYAQLMAMKSKDQSNNYHVYYLMYDAGYSGNTVYDPRYGQVTDAYRFVSPQTTGIQNRTLDETNANLNVGVRGTVFDKFDWDASLTYSEDKLHSTWTQPLTNKVQDYFWGPVLGTTSNGLPVRELNLAHYADPISTADFLAMTSQAVNDNLSTNENAQFVFSGPMFQLPGGDAQFAFVAEAQHQHFDLNPDARSTSYYTGADHFLNLNQTAGGGARDHYGTGVEFNLPVYKWLTVSLADRYDDYNDISDIKGNNTWQAGLEIRPTDNLLLRASHQTSFLAPNIMWVYGSPIKSYVSNYDYYTCASAGHLTYAQCNADPNTQQAANAGAWDLAGGNGVTLKAETATSDGYGIVWDAFKNFSVSLDYWKIYLTNKAVQESTDTILQWEASCRMGHWWADSSTSTTPWSGGAGICGQYEAAVQRDASGNITGVTAAAINQAGTKTDGYDASAKYMWSWDAVGDFMVTAGYTHTLRYLFQQVAGDPWTNAIDMTNYVSFKVRTNWSIGWQSTDKKWTANLYGFRDGPRPDYIDATQPDNPATTYNEAVGNKYLPPYVQWNAAVGYKIAPAWNVSLDVTDLMNAHGPYDKTSLSSSYPGYAPIYGIVGRAIYLNLDVDF